MSEQLDKTLHILIYRTGGIGDVVLSTVSLDILYKLNQPVKIYWVGFNTTSELIESSYPDVTSILISRENNYSQNINGILSKVERLDLVIDLQKSARSIILCKRVARRFGASYTTWNKGSLRRSKEVIKARFSGRRGKFRESILVDDKPRNELMSACVIKALAPFVEEIKPDYSPQLPLVTLKNSSPFETNSKRWVAVATGGLHDAKWAPESLISEILVKMKTSFDAPIGLVFLGDENDLEPTNKVIEILGDKFEIKNYCNQGTLHYATSIIRWCDVMLTNDTALAHISEAVNVNVATLFGPTVEAFGYSPFRKLSKSFSAELNCRPCTKDGDITCRFGDKRCFSLIDSDEVAQFLVSNLKPTLSEKA